MVLLLMSIFNIVGVKNIFQVKSNKLRMLSETDKMSMGPLLLLVEHSSDLDIKKHILTIKKIYKRVNCIIKLEVKLITEFNIRRKWNNWWKIKVTLIKT